MRKYDIGLSDSPYLKDLNEGCYEIKEEVFCDCKGEPFCVYYEEQLPFRPKNQLIGPIFISTTWGSEVYRVACINKDMHIRICHKKDVYYVHIQYPFKVGDTFKVQGDRCANYYVHSRPKQRNDIGWLIEVRRLDDVPMSQTDLDKFKKNKRLNICGYLAEKKTCSCC